MSENIKTIHASARIEKAAEIMKEYKIKKFSKSEKFVNERKEYWQKLQMIINKINKKSFNYLMENIR